MLDANRSDGVWPTYVPALRHQYSDEEHGEEDCGADPPICDIWCHFVQIGLIYLKGGNLVSLFPSEAPFFSRSVGRCTLPILDV